MTKTLNKNDLAQFTGSEHWYRHGINRKVLFTDGAKYVADQARAYWLLDEIAIIQPHNKRIAAEDFQVWTLAVNAGSDQCDSDAHTEFGLASRVCSGETDAGWIGLIPALLMLFAPLPNSRFLTVGDACLFGEGILGDVMAQV